MDPINPDQAQGSRTASFRDYSQLEFLQNFRVDLVQPTHAVLDDGRLQDVFTWLIGRNDQHCVVHRTRLLRVFPHRANGKPDARETAEEPTTLCRFR